jgi:peptidoglycan/LPS O-acetylase OafA/YrhL
MVTTGKISYAWYLWHWPLLAIARVNDLRAHNLARDILLAALAYVLAYLSTFYLSAIERTFGACYWQCCVRFSSHSEY